MFWKKRKQEIKKSKTKKFGLLGEDIQYSLSPKIHAIIYRELGVDATYELFDVKKEDFDNVWDKLYKLDGFNVTKPYKKEIREYLLGVYDSQFSAVNAVDTNYYLTGKMFGYNTDYSAFLQHMNDLQVKRGYNFNNENALVLGAGGVADVVVPILKSFGIEVNIYNRTHEKALDLSNKYCVENTKNKSRLSYNIVVNCTSYGLNKGENIAEGIDFSDTLLAYDTIYFDTDFIKTAQKANVPLVINGLDMLIYQAVASAEIFLDTEIKDKKALKETILKEIKSN